ncbi:MAG: Mut7-C RNAse domain-containing protein [Balneolaceae bacterium]|nr:Mut7-C RNAse domain-containing protein [Balneolaceae bacterium]
MPGTAHIGTFRFLGSLNDHLPDTDSPEGLDIGFDLAPSVKDVIESAGVPHVEVYGIRVNGEWKDFSYNLRDGDDVTVYPKERIPDPGRRFDLKPADRLPDRFVADLHLGKLARLLRLTGIDTLYDNELGDAEIVRLAEREGRAVLSRDIGLLKHGSLGFGYRPRSDDPDRQVVETLAYFELAHRLAPFSRCMACNGRLEPAASEEVEHRVPEGVKAWNEEYRRCATCGKIYWKGSHYEKLRQTVADIRTRLAKERQGS